MLKLTSSPFLASLNITHVWFNRAEHAEVYILFPAFLHVWVNALFFDFLLTRSFGKRIIACRLTLNITHVWFNRAEHAEIYFLFWLLIRICLRLNTRLFLFALFSREFIEIKWSLALLVLFTRIGFHRSKHAEIDIFSLFGFTLLMLILGVVLKVNGFLGFGFRFRNFARIASIWFHWTEHAEVYILFPAFLHVWVNALFFDFLLTRSFGKRIIACRLTLNITHVWFNRAEHAEVYILFPAFLHVWVNALFFDFLLTRSFGKRIIACRLTLNITHVWFNRAEHAEIYFLFWLLIRICLRLNTRLFLFALFSREFIEIKWSLALLVLFTRIGFHRSKHAEIDIFSLFGFTLLMLILGVVLKVNGFLGFGFRFRNFARIASIWFHWTEHAEVYILFPAFLHVWVNALFFDFLLTRSFGKRIIACRLTLNITHVWFNRAEHAEVYILFPAFLHVWVNALFFDFLLTRSFGKRIIACRLTLNITHVWFNRAEHAEVYILFPAFLHVWVNALFFDFLLTRSFGKRIIACRLTLNITHVWFNRAEHAEVYILFPAFLHVWVNALFFDFLLTRSFGKRIIACRLTLNITHVWFNRAEHAEIYFLFWLLIRICLRLNTRLFLFALFSREFIEIKWSLALLVLFTRIGFHRSKHAEIDIFSLFGFTLLMLILGVVLKVNGFLGFRFRNFARIASIWFHWTEHAEVYILFPAACLSQFSFLTFS